MMIICFVLISKMGIAQHVFIFQKKIVDQVLRNMSEREAHVGLLKNILKKTKEVKQKTLASWTTVTAINNKVYYNLTNASDGIRNGKMMVSVTKKIPEIIENVSEAGKIAVGKPYLITIWNETGRMLVDRSLRLYSDINAIVLSADKEMLINQAKRDEILWRIYRQITIIYNMSRNMIFQFKYYNLQRAINKVLPYEYYINLDKNIVHQTLQNFKF